MLVHQQRKSANAGWDFLYTFVPSLSIRSETRIQGHGAFSYIVNEWGK